MKQKPVFDLGQFAILEKLGDHLAERVNFVMLSVLS